MTNPLNILILDEHIRFAKNLAEGMKGISYVGEFKICGTLCGAAQELSTGKYNYLLVDPVMLETDNDVIEDFITDQRKRDASLIIIIVSSVVNVRVLKRYFNLGINGYLSKIADRDKLQQTLHITYLGERSLCADSAHSFCTEKLQVDKTVLTRKELEVLSVIAAGHTVKKTAELLFLSPYTIMAHRRNIMSKLNLHSGPELVKYAFENKLV